MQELRRLCHANAATVNIIAANSLFERLLHAREAVPEHLHLLIPTCRTSRDMWSLIKKAKLGGLKLDVVTCTILARKLQDEGDQVGLDAIISTMHRQGL